MDNETLIVGALLYSLFTFFIGIVIGDFHADKNLKGGDKSGH